MSMRQFTLVTWIKVEGSHSTTAEDSSFLGYDTVSMGQ